MLMLNFNRSNLCRYCEIRRSLFKINCDHPEHCIPTLVKLEAFFLYVLYFLELLGKNKISGGVDIM